MSPRERASCGWSSGPAVGDSRRTVRRASGTAAKRSSSSQSCRAGTSEASTSAADAGALPAPDGTSYPSSRMSCSAARRRRALSRAVDVRASRSAGARVDAHRSGSPLAAHTSRARALAGAARSVGCSSTRRASSARGADTACTGRPRANGPTVCGRAPRSQQTSPERKSAPSRSGTQDTRVTGARQGPPTDPASNARNPSDSGSRPVSCSCGAAASTRCAESRTSRAYGARGPPPARGCP